MNTFSKFLEALPSELQFLHNLAQQSDLKFTIVGGSVRDFLHSGVIGHDLDIEVRDQRPESRDFLQRYLSFFLDQDQYEIESLPFSIFRLQFPPFTIEFSPPRADIYPPKNCYGHKDFEVVVDGNLSYADAFLRRDFSINAMALELGTPHQFIDPFEGAKDLESGVLRTMNPDFKNDPVRLLRALRFKRRFNFKLDVSIIQAFKDYDFSKLTPFHYLNEAFKSEFSAFNKDFFELAKESKSILPLFLQENEQSLLIVPESIPLNNAKEWATFVTYFGRGDLLDKSFQEMTMLKKSFISRLQKSPPIETLEEELRPTALAAQSLFFATKPIEIRSYASLSAEAKERALVEIKEIFFESSNRREFKSQEDRDSFFHTWAGGYLTLYPDHFFLAISHEGRVMGYLAGALSTKELLERHNIPGLYIFSDLFASFPAHLHINCSSEYRGRGVGAKLVDHFVSLLKGLGVEGLHIVTGKESRNVSFYRKMGFLFSEERSFKTSSMYFMGAAF